MTIYTIFNNLYTATNNWLDKATKKGTWTKADQEWYDATKRINPFIGMYEDRYKREQYMDRYNLDYSGVVQPWNLPGGSDLGGYSSMLRRGLNFVSHNYDSLYEEEKDPAEEWMKKQYRADFRR